MGEAGEDTSIYLPFLTGSQVESFLNSCLLEKIPGEEVWQILNLINPEVGRKQSETNVSEPTKDLKPVNGELALEGNYYLEGVNDGPENYMEEGTKVRGKIKEVSKEEVESIPDLKDHVQEIHSQSHECNVCGYEALQLQTLSKHKYRKHGEVLKTKKSNTLIKTNKKNRKIGDFFFYVKIVTKVGHKVIKLIW